MTENPFDSPSTLWERITFPSLSKAWMHGWLAGSGAPTATDPDGTVATQEYVTEVVSGPPGSVHRLGPVAPID